MTPNPLLAPDDLPRFDLITPQHVRPALESLLAAARDLVERMTASATPPTWDAFAAPLAEGLDTLSRAWGIVGHLHSVNDTSDWRAAYNDLLPEISSFYAELGQNLGLFAKYRALHDSPEYATLSAPRQRIVDNEIRDFRLSGAELPEAEKPRFKALQEELSTLYAKFSENILDATNAFAEVVTDPAELSGLPADVVEAARQAAASGDEPVDGWRFSLHMPSYLPVLQYADSRRLRETLYRAYATRAAEFTEHGSLPDWNNAPLIERILQLRAEEARMLGFSNFAEVSLVAKMAESPAEVLAFLRDIAAKARPFAERDVRELREFASSELGLATLDPWDIGYVSEKLKQARYSFSDDEVKQYFPEPRVVAGLFRVIETLFAVRILSDTAPVWHPDVRFYRIESPAGELVGQFYLDLYARDTKRGGAWMDEAATRRRCGGELRTPIAYLNCNFSRPLTSDGSDGKPPRPACFTHDEVITLFHETGHGLHHLLTRQEELGISGIHGVEWDAVELPSQFLENFCWEWQVLQDMTGHIDSGEPLPRPLFERMLAARNFQGGMQTARQLEFGLFDMLVHCNADTATQAQVMALLEDVRREVAVIFPPPWHRFPNSFSHVFAGGYAAGYYSYKWAEVLSADAYEAFEEAARSRGTVLDPDTGRRFVDEILGVGGSRPAIVSFRAFRGREPRVDALLRHSGMISA